MSSVPKLRHPALRDDHGAIPLSQARLKDQERLAVVLQGVALLAHLEHAGCCLRWGWDRARISGRGLLRVGGTAVGKSVDLPQVLLLELLRILFPSRDDRGRITGKGAACTAARGLRKRWQQLLVPVSLDAAVGEVLERAPFLWQDTFGPARVTLLAEHRDREQRVPWIAGPGQNRSRLLALSPDFAVLAAQLSGPGARDLWEGWRPEHDPVELVGRGQYRQATVCWRRRPPRRHDYVLMRARSHFVLGQFSRAADVLRARRGFDAGLLRLKCLMELGRQTAAQQLIARLAKRELSGPETLDLAEVAVRVLGRQGGIDASQEWVDRAFRASARRKAQRRRAELLAAEAAWDRGDMESMSSCLVRARGALDDPDQARRWHEVRSLLAIGERDGAGVVEHSTAVLRDRRRMTRTEAGRRWNDLAYGRMLSGDLAGAERAIRHAQRLLDATDSASHQTLALANLASVRLRRGFIGGVSEAVDASMAENRRAENDRGLVGDLELAARLNLVQGRPEPALSRCGEALEIIAEKGVGDPHTFEILAARAHGWLGNRERSAAFLVRLPSAAFFELEPEERPAVWALAGDAERAFQTAANTPWTGLWSAYAAGLHPKSCAWDELDRLEDFRAARLVFDYLMVAPETVPPDRIRRAIEHLRAVEAFSFAAQLERRFSSPWLALGSYLEETEVDVRRFVELFDSAGYPDVRLVFRRGDRDVSIKPGKGGEYKLELPHEDGRLVLETSFVDPTVRALLRLVQRDVHIDRIGTSLKKGGSEAPQIIGNAAGFLQARKRLDQLARGELPLLILGESGTGKELVAQRVHKMSRRAGGLFRDVNCAALPDENLVQSELFGHKKGSFTGADEDHAGIFEQARGGTVFLDEIGDLPPAVQGKLLRVLQEGELRRMGDADVRPIDVRVVAATHRDLARMVKDGEFRKDLYFRLKGAKVTLPPLRERGDDALLLAEFFLEQHRKKQTGPGTTPPKLSKEARALLLSYPWPGNVRELKQTMECALMLSSGGLIRKEDLGIDEDEDVSRVNYHQQLEHFKRRLVTDALQKSRGNRARAARYLGLTRQALSYLARQMDLP